MRGSSSTIGIWSAIVDPLLDTQDTKKMCWSCVGLENMRLAEGRGLPGIRIGGVVRKGAAAPGVSPVETIKRLSEKPF